MADFNQTNQAIKSVSDISNTIARVNSAIGDIGANKASLQSSIDKIQAELEDAEGTDFAEYQTAIDNANLIISKLTAIEAI